MSPEAQLDAAQDTLLAKINKLDRNIVPLLEDIVHRCMRIFVPASGAVLRTVEAKPLRNLGQPGLPPRTAEITSCERLVAAVRALFPSCPHSTYHIRDIARQPCSIHRDTPR